MKILYFGSDVFLPVFNDLVNSSHEIVALYTYHDAKEYIRDENIVHLAQTAKIPVHHDRISDDAMIRLFEEGKIDLVISAEYDRRIPTPKIEKYRGVNIHNSLLPQGRGYFPIESRLIQGYDYGGVTIHKMVEAFDCGDIMLQERFDISQEDNDRILYQRCAQIARGMTLSLLDNLEYIWNNATPQPQGGSYWYLPKAPDYTITTAMTEQEIKHIYRAFGRFTRVEYSGEIFAVEHLVCYNKDIVVPLDENHIVVPAVNCNIDITLQKNII